MTEARVWGLLTYAQTTVEIERLKMNFHMALFMPRAQTKPKRWWYKEFPWMKKKAGETSEMDGMHDKDEPQPVEEPVELLPVLQVGTKAEEVINDKTGM